MSLPERFTSKFVVDQSTDCWEWTSKRSNRGYGLFSVEGKYRSIHRYAYEQLVGPIPAGLQIDHLCRNKACCNPAHLEPVTALENMRRGGAGRYLAEKTHCPRGHPYAGENLAYNKNGGRWCRECNRTKAKDRKRRIKMERSGSV